MPDSVTVIISVYKDVEALRLIIDSLLHQTRLPDEIIISEDAEFPEMAAYAASLDVPFIRHLHQPDTGWRKNRALNRAIAASTGDYLIFIDGDCVPYPTFIEGHLQLSRPDSALCGRRSEPGERFSGMLRRGEMTLQQFIDRYWRNFFALRADAIRHFQEGVYLPPRHWIVRLREGMKRKEQHIVGCNFSCYKSDLERINGFDEDFTMPTTGEDTDVERRLRHFGVQMRSCRNVANVVHLYHDKVFNPDITDRSEALMATKMAQFVCKNGLGQHQDAAT